MESVVGIFDLRAKAEQAFKQIRSLGLSDEQTVFLTPHSTPVEAEAAVNTTDTESPGVGEAMGGAVGAALGAASGATLGAAGASLLVPGVGPVIAAGILGAAVLGLGGAVGGAALGDIAEEALDRGLPHDELFIYEDALRKGHSVLIAFPDDDATADRVRQIFSQGGAESVDAAREDWWLGLRDDEEQYYREQGKGNDFHGDEVSYRRGFEAALNSRFRGRKYDDAAPELEEFFQESGTDEAFRRGYERGLAHYEHLKLNTRKSTGVTG